jgi:GntR family transcriptional regulator
MEELVVVRRRLQLVNDEPAVLSASYFPLWLAEGTRLELPEALPEGPDTAIENLGYRFARVVEGWRLRSGVNGSGRRLRCDVMRRR